MNIRPKTVKRLVILLAACCLIAGAAASVVLFSRRARERQAQAARVTGMEAYKAGNYPLALDELRTYIGTHQDDYDALFAFGDSRSHVGEPCRG